MRTATRCLIVLLANPGTILAQGTPGPQPLAHVWFAMQGFVPVTPGSEFTDLRRYPGGIDLFVAAYLGARRRVGFRIEYAVANGTNGPTFASPIGQLSARNQYLLSFVTVGPQLSAPIGSFRLHAHVAVGWSGGRTNSQIRRSAGDSTLLSGTTNTNRLIAGVELGALRRVGVIHGASSDILVALTAAADYLAGGTVRYITPGGTTVHADGSVTVTSQRTRTDALMLHAGISLGF